MLGSFEGTYLLEFKLVIANVLKVWVAGFLLLASSGCILGSRPQFIRGGSAKNQKVYYLDGAGNLGFGKETVPLGLEDGGYQGQFEHYVWTTYLGPILDQMATSYNRYQGRGLAKKIEKYLEKNPGASVNIIALSAGTGVAVFALEALPSKYQVDNVMMLSSSLSAEYDLTRALRRVRGGMYFYWSTGDPILRGLVPVVGTVDGENTTQVAGAIGARVPSNASRDTRQMYMTQVHNVRWYPHGSIGPIQLRHAGTTDRDFIRDMVAPILVRSAPRAYASPPAQDKPGAATPSTRPARVY